MQIRFLRIICATTGLQKCIPIVADRFEIRHTILWSAEQLLWVGAVEQDSVSKHFRLDLNSATQLLTTIQLSANCGNVDSVISGTSSTK